MPTLRDARFDFRGEPRMRGNRLVRQPTADRVDRGGDAESVALVFLRGAALLQDRKQGLQLSAAAKRGSDHLACQFNVHCIVLTCCDRGMHSCICGNPTCCDRSRGFAGAPVDDNKDRDTFDTRRVLPQGPTAAQCQ